MSLASELATNSDDLTENIKGKGTWIYRLTWQASRRQSTQTWITQFNLQTSPCPLSAFVRFHQMAPPRTVVTTSSCSLLLIYRPRKDERLSWPRLIPVLIGMLLLSVSTTQYIQDKRNNSGSEMWWTAMHVDLMVSTTTGCRSTKYNRLSLVRRPFIPKISRTFIHKLILLTDKQTSEQTRQKRTSLAEVTTRLLLICRLVARK